MSSAQPAQPHFAFDADGNGLAVWIQSDGMTSSVWTRRYTAGVGWAMSAKLMVNDSGTPSSPRVAMAGKGRGLVVWTQTANSDSDVWAVRSTGMTLGAPGRIDIADMGSAYDPMVALDDNGDGFAVWTQSGGSQSQIWVNHLLAAKGWAGPQAIATPSAGGAFSPQLAIDAHGNASVVWTQSIFVQMGMPQFKPWAARFDAASGHWHPAVALDDNGSAGFPNSQLFGPDGKVLAVWPRMTSGRVTIRASSYSGGPSWSDSIDVAAEDADWSSVMPNLALSPSGIGAAIWPELHDSETGIWANRYDGAADQWSGATELSVIPSTNSVYPELAVDPTGGGFGVWSENRGTSRVIKAARLQADDGFVGNLTLSMDVTADPPANSQVHIDVDAHGNAMAIWDVWEMGQYSVWASAFE
jgi:hypothetical protein